MLNLFGWRTNKKIIVIESDDWGSIRMPSREVYEKALNQGYRVDLNEYEKYDSILSETDIKNLFQLLDSFRDSQGNPPIITANCVVANPDFKKIKESNFSEYYFESILETFKRYPNRSNNFSLWKEGVEKKFLQFQYHAREHLNVSLFMKALKDKDLDVLWGFEHEMPGMIKKGGEIRFSNPYVEATRFADIDDMKSKMDIYFQGLRLFNDLFGYPSKTIIPTNYLWNSDYNENLLQEGVIAIQGVSRLTNPINPYQSKERRFLGESREGSIINLVRNNRFELSLTKDKVKEYSRCIDNIKYAFLLKKPSIISMHRINFSGEIFPESRNENLNYFYDLLSVITKKWPDVEFMSSDQLALEILNS